MSTSQELPHLLPASHHLLEAGTIKLHFMEAQTEHAKVKNAVPEFRANKCTQVSACQTHVLQLKRPPDSHQCLPSQIADTRSKYRDPKSILIPSCENSCQLFCFSTSFIPFVSAACI